jgi:hypothetical protein
MSDITPSQMPVTDPIIVNNSTISKKNSSLSCFLIGCVLLLCITCCICTSIFGFFAYTIGIGISKFGEAAVVFNNFCNVRETDLRDVYEEAFTDSYKSRTSFASFRSLYTENKSILEDICEERVQLRSEDILNGMSINTSSDTDKGDLIEVSFNYKEKRIETRLVKPVGASSFKIDELKID